MFERVTIVLIAIWLAAVPAAFGQAEDPGKPVGLKAVTPSSLRVGAGPQNMALEGWGFEKASVVRVRPAGDKGAGKDLAAIVESPERLRFVVPTDLTVKPGRLEVRVKNPASVSEWSSVAIENSPIPGREPSLDYLSPSEVSVGSHNLRITVRGSGLLDGSAVNLRGGSITRDVRGYLVNQMLVFTLPDELALEPRVNLVQVKSTEGLVSNVMRLTVSRPPPATSEAASGTPFIVAVDPGRVERSKELSVELRALNVTSGYLVLMRKEGAGGEGGRVPLGERKDTPNGTFIGVTLLERMVPETGYYEFQILNPNGARSNWSRLEVVDER